MFDLFMIPILVGLLVQMYNQRVIFQTTSKALEWI